MTKTDTTNSRPPLFELSDVEFENDELANQPSESGNKISVGNNIPSHTEGLNGDMRVGIELAGKSLLAVKHSGQWLFAELKSLSKLKGQK